MSAMRAALSFLVLLPRPFLVAALCLVHCLAQPATYRAVAQAQKQPPPKANTAGKAQSPVLILRPDHALPRPVDEMREAILAAVASGNIEDLREAYDLNEIKPDLGQEVGPGKAADPVAFWRGRSGDGEGREMLAALANILALPAAVVRLGKDVENSNVYVWPYLAELPVKQWTPAQEVEALRLVPVGEVQRMKERGAYTYWRLTIGAEGNWLSLTRN